MAETAQPPVTQAEMDAKLNADTFGKTALAALKTMDVKNVDHKDHALMWQKALAAYKQAADSN